MFVTLLFFQKLCQRVDITLVSDHTGRGQPEIDLGSVQRLVSQQALYQQQIVLLQVDLQRKIMPAGIIQAL